MKSVIRRHPIILVLLVTLGLRALVILTGIQYDDRGLRGALWFLTYVLSFPFSLVDRGLLALGGGRELPAHGVWVGIATVSAYVIADFWLSRIGRAERQ